MNHLPTRQEILEASSEGGLLAYLFHIASNCNLRRESQFIEMVADLVNSRKTTLFTKQDWTYLDGTNGPTFFSGMALLYELIPRLDVGQNDIMQLTATLVRLAGQDLAATQPNAAFRLWCAADPNRVRAVLDAARAGDSLAIEHVCFALEVGGNPEDALVFLHDGPTPTVRMGAATALGRMTLDDESAETAIRSLTQVSIEDEDENVRRNALLATFSALEQHVGVSRAFAKRALDSVLGDDSAETLHLLSELLWRHAGSVTESEAHSILNALQSVDSENRGTLKRIDMATPNLVYGGNFCALAMLVAELIRKSKGTIGLNDFPTFKHEFMSGDNGRLSKLTITWLLEGNLHLCRSLAEQFSAINNQRQILLPEPEDVPVGSAQQLFLCRKAVGFLFHAPVTAASVLVAILRYGAKQHVGPVLDLLYDPLLVSYGGDLVRYLEEVVEQSTDPGTACITEALNRKQKDIDGLVGIETLVELHPSESHRQIERTRWTEHMSEIMKSGMKESIFHDIVKKQYLLYGTSSSSYIEDPDGNTHPINIQMGSHSVSFEHPHMDIFDPEGLHMLLLRFQCERMIKP